MGSNVVQIERVRTGSRFARRNRALVALLGLVLPVGSLVFAAPAGAASPPTLSVGDATVYEGNSGFTPARVTLTLSDPQSVDLVVTYTTVDGGATGGTPKSGSDYVSRQGRVKFRAGKTTAVIAVKVRGDAADEPDDDFGVSLTGVTPAGVVISDSTATITIRNDDATPGAPPAISIGDVTVYEGDGGFTPARVTLTLSEPQSVDLVVTYTTVDGGAAGGTPKSGSDYVNRQGRVKFRALKTSAAIAVKVRGDAGDVLDEDFGVSLTSVTPSGVVISDSTASITIRNDEPSPVPDVPTALAAAPGPFPRYLTATWGAPLGGAAVDGYDLEVTRAGTTNVLSNVTSPDSFGCGVASVTDSCTMRVRAFNGSGVGAWSDPVTASTWAPPDAPLNLRMLGGSAVEWDAPPSDRPIDNYWVQKSVNGGLTWTQVTTTMNLYAATTCSICLVRVAAYSEVGFGAYATIDFAFAPPTAPTALTVIRDSANPALLHISWGVPVLATPPVDEYVVTVNDFVLPPLTLTGITATSVDVRMRNPTMVLVTVLARNAAGLSVPASLLVPAG